MEAERGTKRSCDEVSEKTKVRIASGAGTTFGVDDIAVAHATSGRFWELEGLDVEWVPARGGVKVVEAVLGKQVDAGYGTWVPCVASQLEGQPIKILGSMAQALAQNLIVNKDTVSSPAELRGKRWAVDGIGALSHTLGLLIAKGLGIAEHEIEWIPVGPPPQRIEQLLNGGADCSLVRVEEAAVLARQHPEKLAKLLGFEEILPLAPVQPHGVISVTEAFAKEKPEVCAKLLRGLVRASRSLHDSLEDFREAVRQHVTERPKELGDPIQASDEEIAAIWEREVAAGSFAVNGGLSSAHWAAGMRMFAALRDGKGKDLTLEDIALPELGTSAIASLGPPHAGTHDRLDVDGASWKTPLVSLAQP